MPLFMFERNFAEQLDDLSPDVVGSIHRVNDDVGVRWLYSFPSVDKKKTYCLYEAPSAETIREAARRLNIPADAVVELTAEIRSDGSLVPISG